MDGVREIIFYFGDWNKSKTNWPSKICGAVVNRTLGIQFKDLVE